MEISKFCYQCRKYQKDKFVNDMGEKKPSCFKPRRCGGCLFSEGVEGKNGVVCCAKLNVLRNEDAVCIWDGN